MTEMPVELLLAPELPAAQEQELARLFAALGVQAQTRRGLAHRGAAELDWLVLMALPLQAFLSGLGSEAVKDVYDSIKGVVRARVKDSRRDSKLVPLVLQDSVSGLRIVLEPDLPAEAIHQLVALDLSAYEVGPLHYDRSRHAWRSELDEAATLSSRRVAGQQHPQG